MALPTNIPNPRMDWVGLTPEEMAYDPEADEAIQDEWGDDKRPITKWNEPAAREYANKLAMATETDDPTLVESMIQELVERGESPVAASLEERLKQEDRQVKARVGAELAQETGVDVATEVFKSRINEETDLGELVDNAATDTFVAKHMSGWDDETFDTFLENEKQLSLEFDREYAKSVQFSGSTAGNVLEFFGSMVPFNEQNSVRRMLNDLEKEFGEDISSSWEAMVLTGESTNKIAEWMEAQDAETQLEIMEFIVDNADEWSGFFGGNDFIKLNMLVSVLDKARGEFVHGELDNNRIINNAVGLLDLLGVGAAAKQIVKGGLLGGVSKSSAKAKIDRVDPQTGKQLTAEVVMNEGTVARNVGTTREDVIIQDLLTRQEGWMDVPAVATKAYERSMDLVSELLGRERNIADHLTEHEKNLQLIKTTEQLERLGGSHLWENASTMRRVDDGVEVDAVFGKSSESPYSLKEANTAVAKLKKQYPQATVKILARTHSGVASPVEAGVTEVKSVQKLREASEKVAKAEEQVTRLEIKQAELADKLSRSKEGSKANAELKKEVSLNKKALSSARGAVTRATKDKTKAEAKDFFVQVTFKDNYRAGSNAFVSLDDIYLRGSKAKFIGDVSSGLAKHLSDSFYTGFDRSRSIEKLMVQLMEPFTGASNATKKRVVQLLDEGAQSEKTFKASEILDRLPSDLSNKEIQSVIDGYYAVRQAADVSYEMLNRMYRDKLVNDGMLHLKAGEVNTIGKLYSPDQARDLRVAYDAKTREVVELTPAKVRELQEQGVSFYRTETILSGGENRTKNLLLREGDKVNELPEKVLNYRDGYIPRMYKEQYFITTRPKRMRMDGKALEETEIPIRTVAVAKSRKQAEEMVEAMRLENPETVIDWKHDKALTFDNRASTELDYELNTGGLFFSKRGEHIKDVNNQLAEVVDPVNSIYRMVAGVARRTELEPVLDLMKRRWVNRFGHLTQGKYPGARSAINHPTQVAHPDAEAGKAMWDYIDMMSGSATATQQWRAFALRFGEWAENVTGSQRLGNFLRTGPLSERSPLSLARGGTFISMIVLNPVRQLFIQSQQALFLSGLNPKYVLSGKAHADGMAVLLAHSADATPATKEAFRKVTGLSKGEWDEMNAAFRESGLLEAVDSHLIGRDALLNVQKEITDSVAQAAVQNTGIAAKKAIGAIRAMGFDTGEMWNIATTYMVARRRWLKNNPGKDITSSKARLEVAADTRQLALGMTQAGSLGYQHGWLSLSTQFLSVQQKALMAMARGIPGLGKFGNKAITPQEARRIALFQTLLYGASGTGLAYAVDNVLSSAGLEDLPQEAKHMLYGGIYDTFVNGALSVATGDDVDLMFANNIAAGSGMQDTLFRIAQDIGGESDLLTLLAGPSATFGSRVGQVVGDLRNLLGAVTEGESISKENLRVTLDKVGSIASGYNNFVKGQAMKNHRRWVFSNMSPMPIEASEAEAYIAAALGITGYKQGGYYEYLIDSKQRREKIEETANQYYDNIVRKLARMQGDIPEADAHIMLAEDRIFLEHALDPHDAEAVFAQVGALIIQRVDRGEGALMDLLVQRAMNNREGSGFADLVSSLQIKGLIDAEQAEILMTLRANMYGVEE